MKDKELLEKIALNVKAERFKQKITQEHLAELSNLSINCISNIENAKQDVRVCSMNAVALALGKELKDLI
jgi:transcriptional regulator with XRE-family HTH domain